LKSHTLSFLKKAIFAKSGLLTILCIVACGWGGALTLYFKNSGDVLLNPVIQTITTAPPCHFQTSA